ncbi:hypothetical protein L596_017701 [Steinernema carpocapsae]|nr:hypothetical protein L596_017701 [Steinernema carpocapsae]
MGGRCAFDQFDCDPTSEEKFCVPFSSVRDCFPDCPNSEDEQCGLNQALCDKNHGSLSCGKCVSKSDVNTKCLDRKWHHLCMEIDVFRCKNNQNCVLLDWLNDGEDDCGDGSDEDPCHNGSMDCQARITPVTSGSYVPEKPKSESEKLDPRPASDCAELLALNPHVSTGNYTAYDWSCANRSKCPFPVYCDNEFAGGGWTMVMKRWDDSQDFNKSWNEYKCGFGNVERGDDFWIGNDRLHSFTAKRQCPTELIVRMQPVGTNQPLIVAKYSHFAVADELDEYRLSLGPVELSEHLSGTDALLDARNNPFITFDHCDKFMCPSNPQFGFWSSGACTATILTSPFKAKNYHPGIKWGAVRQIKTAMHINFESVLKLLEDPWLNVPKELACGYCRPQNEVSFEHLQSLFPPVPFSNQPERFEDFEDPKEEISAALNLSKASSNLEKTDELLNAAMANLTSTLAICNKLEMDKKHLQNALQESKFDLFKTTFEMKVLEEKYRLFSEYRAINHCEVQDVTESRDYLKWNSQILERENQVLKAQIRLLSRGKANKAKKKQD